MITVWTDLVTMNSGQSDFQAQLWHACRLKMEKTAAVTAWQGLVEWQLNQDGLYFQMNIALAEAGNVVAQATVI